MVLIPRSSGRNMPRPTLQQHTPITGLGSIGKAVDDVLEARKEEKDKKEFSKLFGEYLRVENILQNYDEFTALKALQTVDVNDAQAVAQGRDAGVFAGRAGGQPALQGGHVEHRRIEFDALHGEVLAARADGAPWQRDEDAPGAQQCGVVARALRDDIVQHQLRRAAQAVVGAAGTDVEAEAGADPVQQEPGGTWRLQ